MELRTPGSECTQYLKIIQNGGRIEIAEKLGEAAKLRDKCRVCDHIQYVCGLLKLRRKIKPQDKGKVIHFGYEI